VKRKYRAETSEIAGRGWKGFLEDDEFQEDMKGKTNGKLGLQIGETHKNKFVSLRDAAKKKNPNQYPNGCPWSWFPMLASRIVSWESFWIPKQTRPTTTTKRATSRKKRILEGEGEREEEE